MIDKATMMANIVAPALQAVGFERAPTPSVNKDVDADPVQPPVTAPETDSPPTPREATDRVAPVERTPPKASDLWRSRFDAETFKMFTEVVHPVTREPLYRIPPGQVSKEAEREGEEMSREERKSRDLTLIV